MRRKNKILSSLLCLCLAVLLTACAKATAPEPTLEPTPTPSPSPEPELLPSLCISELMCDNRSSLALEDGSFPAWIELHNTGEEAAELGGFTLCLGEESWSFPEFSLAPGAYCLIFCDGGTSTETELHSSFVLDREGRKLSLLSPRGTELLSLKLPRSETDISLCLGEDGAYEACRLPSPGFENGEAGYLAVQRQRTLSARDLSIGEAMVYNEWYLQKEGAYYGFWNRMTELA